MFIGSWLLVSPFVLGYEEMKGLRAGNMLSGAVLVILGLSVIIYNAFDCEKYSGTDLRSPMGHFLKKV